MSTPINSIDYQRFLKLAGLIFEKGDGTLRIYTSEHGGSGSYVSLEMTGHQLDSAKVNEVFHLDIAKLFSE